MARPFPAALATLVVLAPALRAQVPGRIVPVGLVRCAPLGLEAAVGELRLPARMNGASLRLAAGEKGLERPLLTPPKSLYAARYLRADALQRILDEDRAAGAERFAGDTGLQEALAAYGKAHGGRGPASLDEPAFKALLRPQAREALKGLGLVPGADLDDPEAPFLLEVAPRVDDGRHWVWNPRLVGRRRPVDPALLQRAGQRIRRDRMVPLPPPEPGPDDLVPFRVVGLRRGKAAEARLELWFDGRKAGDLAFPMPETAAQDPEPLVAWLGARAFEWSTDAPFSEGLWTAAASAYPKAGLPFAMTLERAQETRRLLEGGPRDRREAEGAAPSLLGLLGGRAAVDETLQLDRNLAAAAGGDTVPLAGIPGIGTPPHPWAAMRKGRPAPPSLALADCVPLDRALLYLPKPADALASLEGGGAAFLGRVNSFLDEQRLDTSVVARALEGLGLGSGLGRRLLALGAVREAVAFSPDLAFLSGTEVTVVAELAPAAAALLPLPGEAPESRGAGFWARRGPRLFLSTSRAELDRALALHDARGAGSLGRSDELAVVLGSLAPDGDTEAFAYLPDAFIRRLVGPRQRILQLRQAAARRRMEALAAAALLRRMDAPGEPSDPARLKALGYLAEDADLADLTLEADGRVSHRDFGPLDRLHPLERVPLDRVGQAEAEAYERFRETYSQYWRRYFDPIAFRLDAGRGGAMSLETFVLPLLDDSIYRSLRGAVAPGGRSHPRWAVPAVAELGLRLKPELLTEEGPLVRTLELQGTAAFDQPFTGCVSVAFLDGAPVIQLGGGSPATLFDAGLLGRSSDLMALGAVALGTFTRPVAVALELKDPEGFARELRQVGWATAPLPRWFSHNLDGRLSREPDGRLLVRLGLFGLASMRFTARVEDRWLVVSNDASLPTPLVAGTEGPAAFPMGLRLQPAALKQGLPAAFQAAMEGEARAGWGAAAWLAPWIQSGLSPEAARDESRRLLGLAPLLGFEDLEVPGFTVLRRFGIPVRPRMPAFDPAGRFGALEGVSSAEAEIRFEGDGLRARVAWRP